MWTEAAREARDPLAIGLLGLVGERRHQVSVTDDIGAGRDVGLDLAPKVIAPVRGEEQGHGLAVGGCAVGQRVSSQQELAQEQAYRTLRRLARRVRAATAGLEVFDEAIQLRRRARAVDPFENDEDGARGRHGGSGERA